MFRQQVHFISGKGGVGKSVFSCSLAKHFSTLGLKTLLVQVNANDSHSSYLGCDGVSSKIEEVEKNLFVVNMSPMDSIKDYVSLKFNSELINRLLAKEKKLKRFLEFVPGLSELVMMGKIWFHSEELGENRKNAYDKIIVDCPATGHGVKFLDVANVVVKGARKGPLASEAKKISKLLKDKDKSILHIVTLPEEMPVMETIYFLEQIDKKKLVNIGFVVFNNLTRIMAKKSIKELDGGLGKEISKIYQNRRRREKIEKYHFDYLRKRIDNKIVEMPNVSSNTNDVELCGALANIIESLSGRSREQIQKQPS